MKTTKKHNPESVPFQVQNLIDRLLNKSESVELRGNYRTTLEDINIAISEALNKFDKEKSESWRSGKVSKR